MLGGLPKSPALGIEAAPTLGAAPDAVRAVEMAPDQHQQPGTGAAPGLLGDLQPDTFQDHGVVFGDLTGLLVTEDVLERRPSGGDEGHCSVGRRPGELGIVVGQEALLDVTIGALEGTHARQAQLVDQAILQGAVDSFPRPRA